MGMTDETNAASDTVAEATPDATELQAELAKARDEMLRALAEVENTRRRADRQAQEARVYAIDRFAADLLPVADSLSRALQAAPRDDLDEGFRNLLTGVELTERALLEAFARHGLRRIGAKGEAFDPNLHQAVGPARRQDRGSDAARLRAGRSHAARGDGACVGRSRRGRARSQRRHQGLTLPDLCGTLTSLCGQCGKRRRFARIQLCAEHE
jgi:molecular chaperone GrpE (heat shock protein)